MRHFNKISDARRREIASAGGRAAHLSGRAHEFTSEEARTAGRLGGLKVSANREYMSKLGKLGAEARRRNKINAAASTPIASQE